MTTKQSRLHGRVEGAARLLPGTHVDVHVTSVQGRVLVRARVVRCAVWSVTADVITYCGALAFNAPVDLPPVEVAPGAAADLLSSQEP